MKQEDLIKYILNSGKEKNNEDFGKIATKKSGRESMKLLTEDRKKRI